MDRIDPRVITVSIEVDGEARTYSGPMDISVTGEKTTNAVANTCEVKISNLSRDVRNFLLTETSPFNKNKKKKRIRVEAGRESTGTSLVYVGDVTASSPTQPPDIGISLKGQTAAATKGKLVARSGASLEHLQSLAKKAADDMEVELEFSAEDKQIANWQFTGGAGTQVDKLARTGAAHAFVDDETLVVKKRNEPRKGATKKLNKSTGMIGVPEVTEQGVTVKMLYDQEVKIGGALEISSDLNPSIDGRYEIFKLRFELATRAEAFYWVADAKRLDR